MDQNTDEDLMTVQPSPIGAPAGWSGFVTTHDFNGATGYGIEWIANSSAANLNSGGSSSSFTFSGTETPAQMAALSPLDPAFQTTHAFVYQGNPFSSRYSSTMCSFRLSI